MGTMNWRASIGTITPGATVTTENVFNMYAPLGVGITSLRIPWGIPGGGPSPENLKKMASGLEEGCRRFYEPGDKKDLIIFTCTSGSLIGGPTFDKECIQTIESITGSRGLTTSTAILEAFQVLGAGRVAVITPYPDATNEAERLFLEKNGVEVTTIVGMNPERRYIPSLEPEYVYQQTKLLDLTGAEAIFVSCTALNCTSMIRYMEEDFGLPVVTSNQASFWGAMRHAGVGVKRPEMGTLLTAY